MHRWAGEIYDVSDPDVASIHLANCTNQQWNGISLSLSLSRRRDEFLRTKSDLLGAYSFKGAFEASPPMRDPREVMESDLHLN